MKKAVKILIMLAVVFSAAGKVYAQAPDDERIKALITDTASEYYYPLLLNRYMRGDLTLDAEDYYYLYYGYAFQERFRPLEPVDAEAKALMTLESSPDLKDGKAQEMIGYCNEVMERDPFSPRNINFLAYAYSVLGDSANADINMIRLIGIMTTIESSGTGLKESSPWYVIAASHVNDFLASKGYDVQKRMVVSREVEYVTAADAEGNAARFYFDSSRNYRKEAESKPEKPTGLKFKNLQPTRRL